MPEKTNAPPALAGNERHWRQRGLSATIIWSWLSRTDRTSLTGWSAQRRSADSLHRRISRKPWLLVALSLMVLCAAGCAPITPLLPPSTPPFLGPNDFPGGSYTPRSSNATTGGKATYSGYIVFTNISRGLVDFVLPAGTGLELATNSAAGDLHDLHPVIFLFGHQQNTKWLIGGVSYSVPDDYTEMMVLIPFVQKEGGTKWHNYVVRMYLNEWFAIWLGNLFFAYAKEWGTADEFGLGFTEFHDATAYFEAGMQVGTWQTSAQAESALPNYKAIKAIFDMPIVGYDPWLGLKCSYFEFHYDKAMVAALQSQHRFLHSFRPNMSAWVALGLLPSVPDGAIAIQGLDWRIALGLDHSWPVNAALPVLAGPFGRHVNAIRVGGPREARSWSRRSLRRSA